MYPLLQKFCLETSLSCPKPVTIGRLISDLGGFNRIFPQKVAHFGKIKQANRQKILRKPKDFKALAAGQLVALDPVESFVRATGDT